MTSSAKVKVCPECSAELLCQSCEECWCSNYPPILPLKGNNGCLCANCLEVKIKDEVTKYMRELTTEKIKVVQSLGKPSQFIDGIDYTINSNGSWVFTGWYLLRQGECCDNNCTNCPYPK